MKIMSVFLVFLFKVGSWTEGGRAPHPMSPVNALGEINEEYTYGKASRTADVTVGEIKINHDS